MYRVDKSESYWHEFEGTPGPEMERIKRPRFHRVPTVKELMKIPGVDLNKAKLCQDTIRGKNFGTFRFRSERDRFRVAYPYVSINEIKMEMLDDIIEGYGIESVSNSEFGGSEFKDAFIYVNLGDTYIPTICLYNNMFIVSSWGDMYEYIERKLKIRRCGYCGYPYTKRGRCPSCGHSDKD